MRTSRTGLSGTRAGIWLLRGLLASVAVPALADRVPSIPLPRYEPQIGGIAPHDDEFYSYEFQGLAYETSGCEGNLGGLPITASPEELLDAIEEHYAGSVDSFSVKVDFGQAGSCGRHPISGEGHHSANGIELRNTRCYEASGPNCQAEFFLRRERGVGCDPDGLATGMPWCPRPVVEPVKDLGEPGRCPDPSIENPINPAIGNKFQRETDYVGAGPVPLGFERVYNSTPGVASGSAGRGWRHSYERTLFIVPSPGSGDPPTHVQMRRADGKQWWFAQAAGAWLPDADVRGTLSHDAAASEWTFTSEDGHREIYDHDGRLVRLHDLAGLETTLTYYDATAVHQHVGRLSEVRGPFGHTLAFTYGAATGRLETMIDPAGGVFRYETDAEGRLVAVTYPDDTPADASDAPVRTYHYEEAGFPFALTGITDENGDRFAYYDYDDVTGLAIGTRHADSVAPGTFQRETDVAYTVDDAGSVTDATVTGPKGDTTSYAFTPSVHVNRTGAMSNDVDGGADAYAFDAAGNLASHTDAEGHVRESTFTGPQLTAVTEGAGSEVGRTRSIEYVSPALHLVTREVEPSVYEAGIKETVYTRNARHQVTAITVNGHRPDDTPISRTTAFTYHESAGGATHTVGLVASIDGPQTDVADITRYEYNDCDTGGGCGGLSRITSPTGLTETFVAYDAHGRPTEREDANGVATSFAYDARGRLLSRTVAGATQAYTYDRAGQLTSFTTSDGATLTYAYDAAHNLRTITDALGNQVRMTPDVSGLPDKLELVDPGGTVRFSTDTDDLGNVLTENSPDSGVTIFTHDAAGNVITRTDGRGITATYTYDAAGRLTTIAYPDATENVTLVYDETTSAHCANPRGAGRLTSIYDDSAPAGNPSIARCYDAFGHIAKEVRTMGADAPVTATIEYTHDLEGRVLSMTYPSGHLLRR